MKLAIIVAISDDYAIGAKNDLLWHFPNDLKRFKQLTTGHSIIMGHNTFKSLPKGALPNRRNIVISRQKDLHLENCEICNNITDAISLCSQEEIAFIIGGAQIYEQTIHQADLLYLTIVHHPFKDVADRFLPQIDLQKWQLIEETSFDADEKHAYPYSFMTYSKL